MQWKIGSCCCVEQLEVDSHSHSTGISYVICWELYILVAMATTGVSSVRKTNPRGFMAILSYAVCEWFLIFFLFVDAAFSYLLIKFAQYCELPMPCLFCSKIGHSFGAKKNESYGRFLCWNHIEEISSLVSCHVHGNLADVHRLCEECFTPFSVQNKLNSKSYRLLVGKTGLDIERQGAQNLVLHRKLLASPSGLRICSCCGKSWGERSKDKRLLQVTPVGFGASKANVKPPLPRAPGRSRFSRRGSFKKLKDKFSGPASAQAVGSRDHLSHVGYSELRFHSDSESEVPLSDDDDGGYALQGMNDAVETYDAQNTKICQPEVQMNNADFDKQNQQAPKSVASPIDQPMQLDVGKHNNVDTLASDASSAHGLEELNCNHHHPEPSIQPLPKPNSLDDVAQAPEAASSDISIPVEPQSRMPSLLPENISNNIPASSNVMGNLKNSYSHHEGDIFLLAKHSVNALGNLTDDTPTTSKGRSPINASSGVDNKREVLVKPVERLSASETSKVEDMKPLPQIVDTDYEKLLKSDAYLSDGVDIEMLASLERTDPASESLDGFGVGEIEGENVVDRLKKQVEFDKKFMSTLYKELEEERNASAIAANQAMAMINKLQEEKAALHMEAMQYLRMMDEQAEYDMEALEKANDLLSEKEKEVQDLEAELEYYRNNFQEGELDSHQEISIKGESEVIGDSGVIHADSGSSATSHPEYSEINKASDVFEKANGSALKLEEEKLYLVQWLKNLERRIHEMPSSGACIDACNGGYSEEPNKVNHQEDLPTQGEDQIYRKKEVVGLSMKNGLSATNGSSTQDKSTDLVEDFNIVAGENNHVNNNGQKLSSSGGEISLANLKYEIANLSDRLQTLETDRDFLNHAFSALQHGNDGLHFIQEIVNQLQDLRNIEFGRRGLSVT